MALSLLQYLIWEVLVREMDEDKAMRLVEELSEKLETWIKEGGAK